MGAWGIESYNNDATFDLLSIRPDNMTEHQINKSIVCAYSHYINAKRNINDWDTTTLLGTVVFCLELGHKVRDKKYLKNALNIGQKFLRDKDYLADWKTPKQRTTQLQKEIKMIKESLK